MKQIHTPNARVWNEFCFFIIHKEQNKNLGWKQILKSFKQKKYLKITAYTFIHLFKVELKICLNFYLFAAFQIFVSILFVSCFFTE